MSTLVDTKVLLCRLEPAHAHYRDALDPIARLIESGETLHVVVRSIGEFCAAATRPLAQNGLGLDIVAVASAVDEIEWTFGLLPSDEAMVYGHWKRLIVGEDDQEAGLLCAARRGDAGARHRAPPDA